MSSGGDLSWPLARAARLFPEKCGVIDGERSLTYGNLRRRVASLGGGLDLLGAGRGDRIGYLGVNSLAHLECVFGVPAHARVLTDLNFRLNGDELAFMVEDAEVGVLVIDRANLEVGRSLRDRCSCLKTLVLDDDTEESDCVPYELLVTGEPMETGDLAGDQLAAISYTGGTTGRPKGVMLSHGNILANARHNIIATRPTLADTMIHPCPMFHAAGVANLFALVWVGATNVIVPRFDAARVAEEIARHSVTLALLVPTMLAKFLDHIELERTDCVSLRNVQYAASPISPDLQRRAVKLLGCEVAQFYGMTEAAPTVTHLSPDDHAQGVAGEEPYRSRLRSVGIPVPGVEAEVRLADGSEAATEEIGEIWVRGPNVMLGYWRRPEESTNALVDGWYRSGDAGYADQDGYIYLVDRIKDMVVTGGENVYSVEVERVLQEHHAVREAAVFGIPDPHWGEAVHAVVVVHDEHRLPEEESLAEHCRARLAGFKIPRSFDLRSQPLPITGAGKVLKAKLREPYWSDRGRLIS